MGVESGKGRLSGLAAWLPNMSEISVLIVSMLLRAWKFCPADLHARAAYTEKYSIALAYKS